MPDLSVVSPAAVVPADRLTLGSCDARVPDAGVSNAALAGRLMCPCWSCMAEE